jgi:hypothetical protein
MEFHVQVYFLLGIKDIVPLSYSFHCYNEEVFWHHSDRSVASFVFHVRLLNQLFSVLCLFVSVSVPLSHHWCSEVSFLFIFLVTKIVCSHYWQSMHFSSWDLSFFYFLRLLSLWLLPHLTFVTVSYLETERWIWKFNFLTFP